MLKALVNRYAEWSESETSSEQVTRQGRIVAAGLIAGEAIMGIIVGAIRILGVGNDSGVPFPIGVGDQLSLWLGIIAIAILLAFLGTSTLWGTSTTSNT